MKVFILQRRVLLYVFSQLLCNRMRQWKTPFVLLTLLFFHISFDILFLNLFAMFYLFYRFSVLGYFSRLLLQPIWHLVQFGSLLQEDKYVKFHFPCCRLAGDYSLKLKYTLYMKIGACIVYFRLYLCGFNLLYTFFSLIVSWICV